MKIDAMKKTNKERIGHLLKQILQEKKKKKKASKSSNYEA